MSSTRQSQGRFLERLVALKAARGEQDAVLSARQPRIQAGAEGEEVSGEDDGDEEGMEVEEDCEGGLDDGSGREDGATEEAVGISRTGDTAARQDSVVEDAPL